MVDGFHWTRALSKQLRFLCEEVALLPVPERLKALAEATDRMLAARTGSDLEPAAAAVLDHGLESSAPAEIVPETTSNCDIEDDAALRNRDPADGVVRSKGLSR